MVQFDQRKMDKPDGMCTVKVHQETCSKNESRSSTSTQQPLIDHAFAVVESSKTRKPLPAKLKKMWRDEVVDQLSVNPTISIHACANLASAHANYAQGRREGGGVAGVVTPGPKEPESREENPGALTSASLIFFFIVGKPKFNFEKCICEIEI